MKPTTFFAIAALIAAPALVQSNAAFAAAENAPTAAETTKAPAKHKTGKHMQSKHDGKHAKHVRHIEKRSAA